MDEQKLLDYWLEREEQVQKGSSFIVLQLTDNTETELAGYVSLAMLWTETGPFRGFVEKFMVSIRHRYRGVARGVTVTKEKGSPATA